jgi:hypothetical protein
VASLVLGVAGSVIGNALLPGIGGSIGYALGSALGGAISAEKIVSEGPRLQDLKIQNSSYGDRIPEVFGKMRVPGNLIWSTDLHETKKESDEGGKGGGGVVQVTYSYDASFAVALCRGTIQGVRRIWANKILIYDVSDTATPDQLEKNGEIAATMRVYLGDNAQLQDPTIFADKGVDTPAYRGTAYVVFDTMQLANYGNRLPTLEFEVLQQATTNTLSAPELIANSSGNPGVYDVSGSYFTMPGQQYPTSGRSWVDKKRGRVWSNSCIYTSASPQLAFLDLNTKAPNEFLLLGIPNQPVRGGGTFFSYVIAYIPDVDSIIALRSDSGFGGATMTAYEINPDTGAIKSQKTWSTDLAPTVLFWDEFSKQLIGFGSPGLGVSDVLQITRIGGIVQQRDYYAFNTIGVRYADIGKWGWRPDTEQYDSLTVALQPPPGGLSATTQYIKKLHSISSDADWMYVAFEGGWVQLVDPLANFTELIVTATTKSSGGW